METVRSSRDIERMFAHAQRATHPLVIALKSATPAGRSPEGRIVVIAGKKLGGAVLRNRCKRVLRETVRRLGGPWAGYDIALIARAGTPTAAPEELDRAVTGLMERLGAKS